MIDWQRIDAHGAISCYLRERRRLACVPSSSGITDDGHLPSVRLDADDWVALCGLMTGVSSQTLAVLEVSYWGSSGIQPCRLSPPLNGKEEAMVARGESLSPDGLSARSLSADDVARVVGLTAAEVRAMMAAAWEIVHDRLCARRGPQGVIRW